MPKKKKKTPHDPEFEALDRLARKLSFSDTRPLSPKSRVLWEWAKRSKPRRTNPSEER
jgi:hypothetical protein